MPSLRLRLAVTDPDASVSPSVGYTVADPTSLWHVGGKWQAAVTLRRHPDFLAFDQQDHTAMVFEVRSALLDAAGSERAGDPWPRDVDVDRGRTRK